MPVLELRDVVKRYGAGPTEVVALDHVSLAVEPGELVAVMGPSGSGKSTVLHLAGGLDLASAGEVLVGGRDLATLPATDLAALRRRRVGFVFQHYNLVPTLTARENVLLPLEFDGRPGREARRLADASLERVGLSGPFDRFPDDLSGGEQQRVAIARAVAGDRDLVLADEPTGALDTITGDLVIELLAGLRDAGTAGRAGHARAPLRIVGRPGGVPARRCGGRPVRRPAGGRPRDPGRAGAMTGGWGLTLRMAWRESRRRPGRTALVLLVVGLPVAALAVSLVVLRTATPTPAEARAAAFGQADEVVSIGLRGHDTYDAPSGAAPPGRAEALAAVEAAVPAGSRITPVAITSDALTRPDGHLDRVALSDEPLDDPVLAGRWELTAGRAPKGPGEVALTADRLAAAGAEVGDEIALLRRGPVRVTGVVASTALEGATADAVLGGPLDPAVDALPLGAVPREPSTLTFYVDLPAGAAAAPEPLPAPFGRWWPAFDGTDEAEQLRNGLSVAYAFGAVGLLLTSTVAAAGFAVAARRHLRTLGLLAATGVPPAGRRRVMLLQGVVTGAIASAAGLAVAVAAVAGIGTRLDGWLGRAVGPLVVRPLDLLAVGLLGVLAATLAAWLPSRTAARVPVLAALAGRRPQVRAQPGLSLLGVAAAAVGSLVLAYYAASPGRRGWGLGLAAAVLILAGGALCTPWLVARFEPLAGRLRGASRVASRGLARNRLRTSAVAVALMAPAAVTVYGFTVIASMRAAEVYDPQMRSDQALVTDTDADAGTGAADVPDAATMDQVRAVLPGAVEAPLRVLADPAADQSWPLLVLVSRDPGSSPWPEGSIAVASPDLLDALAAPASVADLIDDDATVVALRPVGDDLVARVPDGGLATGEVLFDRSDVVAVESGASCCILPTFVVSEGWAARQGLTTIESGMLLRAGGPLTADQRHGLFQPESPDVRDALIRHEVLGTPPPDVPALSVAVQFSRPEGVEPLAAAAAGGLLLVTLAVVAVALALDAAESRDEQALLAALGASPRVQRATTAWRAAMLPLVGMVVAVPLGLAAGAATVAAVGSTSARRTVPWLLVTLLLVAVPVLSGLLARLAAAVAGRFGRRPALGAALAAD